MSAPRCSKCSRLCDRFNFDKLEYYNAPDASLDAFYAQIVLKLKGECRRFEPMSRTAEDVGKDLYNRKITATGPTYRFRCSQDIRDVRERTGSTKVSLPGSKARSSRRRTGYPCSSSLHVNVDAAGGKVKLNFTHCLLHSIYVNKCVPTDVLALIEQSYKDGSRTPRVVYRAVQARRRAGAFNFRITPAQVRYHLDRIRRRGRRAAAAEHAGETELETLLRVGKGLETVEMEELPQEPGWEAVAWRIKGIEGEVNTAKEVVFDGTFGTTTGNWELIVGFVERRLHSLPAAFLAIRQSTSEQVSPRTLAASRARLMRHFFGMLGSVAPNISIVHCDKAFGEISAAHDIWPLAHVQICLWHAERALDKRLRGGVNKGRTVFNVREVLAILPHSDPTFVPRNATKANRTLVFASTTPAPPHPSPHVTPRAAHTPVDAATAQAAARAGPSYFDADGAPLSPKDAAERARLEYDESEDEYDEGATAEDEREDEWEEVGEGEASGLPTMAGEASGVREVTKSIADPRQREKITNLYMDHFSAHPSIPTFAGRYRTASEIYLSAVRETYQFCHSEGLVDAWAYLWEHWYRPGRWQLWARSSHPEIAVYRTTIGAEAFFRVLKHDLLGKRRVSLLSVLETIADDYAPELLDKVYDRDDAAKTLDFRLQVAPWRGELKAKVGAFWEVEWTRREEEVKKAGGWLAVSPACAAAARRPSGVVQRPPPLPPMVSPNPSIDPALQPRPSIPPPVLNHTPDILNGTCSCPSFLHSRFLLCKHLALSPCFASVGSDRAEDDNLFFSVVERHRTGPFWRVGADVADRLALQREGGVEGREVWDFLGLDDEEGEVAVDEVVWMEEEYGGRFTDDDKGGSSESDGASSTSEDEDEGTAEGRGARRAVLGEVTNAAGKKRARSASLDDDLPHPPSDTASRSLDRIRLALKRYLALLETKVQAGVDPRYMVEEEKGVEALLRRVQASEREVGQGGLADVRASQKAKNGGRKGAESSGSKKKQPKKRFS
ncbi:hypothetical protein JCM10207_007491 [Rhodosporidiobolus poonsookiae]